MAKPFFLLSTVICLRGSSNLYICHWYVDINGLLEKVLSIQVGTVNPIGHQLRFLFGTRFLTPLRGLSRFPGNWIPDSLKGIIRFIGYPGIVSSINKNFS